MKSKPKKPAKAVKPNGANGHAIPTRASLRADAIIPHVKPPTPQGPSGLALPAVKALPAPARNPNLESPKDLTYLTMRLDVLEACLMVASKKDVRHYLEGVFLHADKGELRAVGTNGSTLLLHSSQHVPSAGCATPPDWLSAGVILPRETLALALSAISKNNGQSDAVQIGYCAGHGYAVVRDIAEFATFRLRVVDGTFPSYQKVIEQAGTVLAGGERQPLTGTSMQGEYLKQAAAIGAKFGAKGITPFAGASGTPTVVTFFGEPGALFLIMPLQVQSAEQMPSQTMALIGRGLEGTLAALKATQTRQKKQLAEIKDEKAKAAMEAVIAARDERIATVQIAIKGKLLEAPTKAA
jgi:hypothetical protein